MKAVILLAGRGSRLGLSNPKSMARFANGQTILDYQLNAISQFVPIWDIYLVVGFKKELIMDAAPNCTFIYNKDFDKTNTAKSLMLALRRIDDDILWLNGDVFFESQILSPILKSRCNCVLVNRDRILDEEVCYTLGPDGTIHRLAKHLENASGESLGINFITRPHLQTFQAMLTEVGDDEYFERAIELGIERGSFEFYPIENKGYFVKEMDFQSDFDAINAHIMRDR